MRKTFWWEVLKGKNPRERLRHVGKNIIKEDIKERVWEGVDWIQFVRDMGQWRVLVNTVLHFRVP